jgi:uncharacterized protein YegL
VELEKEIKMSTEENIIEFDELVDNPTTRVPICLCLDTSGSMGGAPIEELNEGVSMFYNAIRSDDVAKYAADICIATFGNGGYKLDQDFAGVESSTAPHFTASGGTPMGEAANIALDALERRKNEFKSSGVDYFQPWLVLMTDGGPNGSAQELERAIQRTVEAVESKKLTVFPIGIGDSADMNVLARFSPGRTPLKLRGLNFKQFFEWLSQSVSRTSQSSPGEKIQLDLEGIKGWGEI